MKIDFLILRSREGMCIFSNIESVKLYFLFLKLRMIYESESLKLFILLIFIESIWVIVFWGYRVLCESGWYDFYVKFGYDSFWGIFGIVIFEIGFCF